MSVFTKEDLNDIPEFNASYNGHCIINIQFSEKDIEEILKALTLPVRRGGFGMTPQRFFKITLLRMNQN